MTHASCKQRSAWLAVMAGLLLTGWMTQVCAQDGDRPGVFGDTFEDRYWAGLVVAPVGEALRDQLRLDEGQGVIVERVAPDGPAAKSGIKTNDILLKSGDDSLGSVSDLMKAVQGSEGKSLDITLLRGGERKTLALAPVKRSSGDVFRGPGPSPSNLPHHGHPPGGPPPGGPDDVFRIRPDHLPQHVWRMLRPGLPLDIKFPDDLTLSVEKKGAEPGRVKVQRGDETWEVADDKLGELPDSVRGYVELYLGKIPTPPLPPEVEQSLARGLPIPLPPGLPQVRERLRGSVEDAERRIGDEALPRVRELQDRLEGLEKRLQRRLQEVERRLEERPRTEAQPSGDES